MSDPAEPFDRRSRRQRRARAAAKFGEYAFLKRAVAAELTERVRELGPEFACGLDLGCHDARVGDFAAWSVALDPALAFAAAAGASAVVADEDRLPFADASFDVVVSALALHGVNDLPGALIQLRRALRPGGLFIAALFGGVSLGELRRDLIEVESALTGRVAARISPMVDVQAAAGLLQRAGFVMPVVDVATLTLRYASAATALADLHGMGEGNILMQREPLRSAVLAGVAARFEGRRGADGKTAVEIEVLTMTGWTLGGDRVKLSDVMWARV